MKTLLLSIFLLIGAWAVKAQPLETQKRQVPVVVPLEKAPELPAPTKSNTQPFSIGAKLPPYQPSFANPSEKSIDFTGKSNLVHCKIELSPKVNNFGNQKEDYKAVKGDQFFGDFTNNGDFVNVYCRDFAAIDGDRISIFVNGVEEVRDIFLVGEFTGFRITLKPGFNSIEFLALNQGESGPNTAEFQVLDDKGKVIERNRWDLATGSKARIVIVKDH